MDVFLIILGLTWIFLASIQDMKKREVYNWISFSLIAFALAYRAFYAVINSDLWFFLYGVFGLLIFIVLGYAFYYARVFAGGDAKLLMALGAVLPAGSFYASLTNSVSFVILLLFAGGLWGMGFTGYLAFKNRKKFSKEFNKQMKKNKILEYSSLVLAIILLFLPMLSGEIILFAIPLLALAFPVLYAYGKAVEESCMIASVSANKLGVGEWLYEPVKFKGKVIEPNWEGLSAKELEILKKYRGKIKIKQGIPFVPGFFFAFILNLMLGNFLSRFF